MVFRENWSYMFNGDAEVAKLVAGVLPLLALFQVGLSSLIKRFTHFQLLVDC